MADLCKGQEATAHCSRYDVARNPSVCMFSWLARGHSLIANVVRGSMTHDVAEMSLHRCLSAMATRAAA